MIANYQPTPGQIKGIAEMEAERKILIGRVMGKFCDIHPVQLIDGICPLCKKQKEKKKK